MNHTILAAVAACGAAFLSSSADAHPIVVSASVPGISIVVGNPPPPVYVAPAPVYVAPAPVYVEPYPVVYAPPRPVVVYERPRYQRPRTVVVAQPDRCGQPGRHHGHHGHHKPRHRR